jgi:tetraacyldisaccharide 4'-kinase
VISIGNITLGGTGKTPFIALLLKHLPGNIGLATRGYRRHAKGLYSTKGTFCSPQLGGDEAVLIGRRFPSIDIAVSEDKWEAVHALDGRCDVILLDDGLQRYDIPQHIQIATVDCGCPDGYGWILPRGLCREPFSRLRHVDCIVITNADDSLPALLASLQPFSRPIIVTVPVIERFFSFDGSVYTLARGHTVALFSGIAHPERFRSSMETRGFHVVDHLILGDHADITDEVLLCFAEKVHSCFPDAVFVGTEKDWARKETWPDILLCFSQMELHVIEGYEVLVQVASGVSHK